MKLLRGLTIICLLALACTSYPSLAQARLSSRQKTKPFIQVSGFGFLGNLFLKNAILSLNPIEDNTSFLDTAYIEDALFISVSEIKNQGYLKPSFSIEVINIDGSCFKSKWTDGFFDPIIPDSIQCFLLHIQVEEGVLYYFNSIQAQGLDEFSQKAIESFFYPKDAMIITKGNRFYTPTQFQNGIDNILLQLENKGYVHAMLSDESIQIDDHSGSVDISFSIERGLKHFVHTVTIFEESSSENPYLSIESHITENHNHTENNPHSDDTDLRDLQGNLDREDTASIHSAKSAPEETLDQSKAIHAPYIHEKIFSDQIYNRAWLSHFTNSIRNRFLAEGYADVIVKAKVASQTEKDSVEWVDLEIQIYPGPQVVLGEVRLINTRRFDSTFRKETNDLIPGEPLNTLKAEEDRVKLAQIGILQSASLSYENVSPLKRDVIYTLIPQKRNIVSLILGVGSYDIIRTGIEYKRNGIFQWPHTFKAHAIQSFKSTEIESTYTIPHFLNKDIVLFTTANYFERDEITFKRREFGIETGLQHFSKRLKTNLIIQYNYEKLRALDLNIPTNEGTRDAKISSIELIAQKNQIDNPVLPENGYRIGARIELSSPLLGGGVEYQRIEINKTLHYPISNLTFLHFRIQHGVLNTFSNTSENIPFAKRFFLGGETTVRGFRLGQASPADASGQIVGAETYVLFNAEIEQKVIDKISIIAFLDTVGFGKDIKNYPFNKVLYSIGPAISYRTMIGPLRFSYGYNLNPRSIDPKGAFHFGLGFPF